MTEPAEPWTVPGPGVYADIPHDVYLADPIPGGSLSASGAKRLLPPFCPALYRHWADHPQPPKREFDIGHAAHRLVLGAGPDIHPLDFEDWRTKAAQTARDEARAAGLVPLLRRDHDTVWAMAAALRAHPVAAALFDPDRGRPEQSLFWQDGPSGVWLRARLDWLPNPRAGRLIIGDYKTTSSAEPEEFARSAYRYGYFQQAAWYIDAATALGLGGGAEPEFVFVAQEKEPPYLITVAYADDNALGWARERNRDAIDLYADCAATGEWPTYSSDVVELSLPPWVENRYLQEDL